MGKLKEWSTLAKIVFKRTYARETESGKENWKSTVGRVIDGNGRIVPIGKEELKRLEYFILNRKAMPAGRGLWTSGTENQRLLGGASQVNCWFFEGDDWNNIVLSQDLLMLGGGVGFSVEHRYVSKLSKIKKEVIIENKETKDADFIVPDSREGWVELTRRILESYFETGKSFSYSTVCIRNQGEPIKVFGGTASGPIPLKNCVSKICDILDSRAGKHVRPIDVGDILCAIGEMVVAGNVRRSAILLLGDPFDKEFLKAKRWDLGPTPTQRSQANYSVVCDDVDDLHPTFWKTYEQGEPFGLVNRKTIKKFGRMGEKKSDPAQGVNPCAEANLENGEPCNLLEIFLPNLSSVEEFEEGARLMLRYGKRVCMEDYHHEVSNKVIKKNMRIGIGITGCLGSPLFTPEILDRVYKAIQDEDIKYSKELGVSTSIKTTVVKPSGTLSLLGDVESAFYPALSRYLIRRVQFASSDPLIPVLREANHHMEYLRKMDGTVDEKTLVVDFYKKVADEVPCVDEGFDIWKQLDTLKFVQKHWADQSASVTVYYRDEHIPEIKEWLKENLNELKTISFLKESGHGFDQAPLEPISKEEFERLSAKVKPIDIDSIDGSDINLKECEDGHCPIK